VIGISSGKGGVGKTTVATNLAIALSKLGRKVIVIDCNISTPHLTYYLGAYKYDTTLNDVLRGKARITSALYHHNGVMFIPASLSLEDLIALDMAKLKRNVDKLINPDMIDFIILDSAPGIGREALSVMNASSEILLVTLPSYPTIRDAVRSADVVRELGEKKLGLLLNMVNSHKFELSKQNIEAISKLPVLGKISFDRNIANGLAIRKPVIKYRPHSISSVQFMQLASNLVGDEYTPPRARAFYNFYDRVKAAFAPDRAASDFLEEGF
jgi:septum site-determining protein MinD